MGEPNYYQRNRDVLLNKSKEHYRNNRELILERIRNKYKSLPGDKKNYQKEYRKNMSDEQKQKYRETKRPQYHNMTDEQKQKYKDYQENYKKI